MRRPVLCFSVRPAVSLPCVPYNSARDCLLLCVPSLPALSLGDKRDPLLEVDLGFESNYGFKEGLPRYFERVLKPSRHCIARIVDALQPKEEEVISLLLQSPCCTPSPPVSPELEVPALRSQARHT
jgi:hypothetical protein